MVTYGIRECRSPGDAHRPHVLARKTSVCGARRCTEVAHASPLLKRLQFAMVDVWSGDIILPDGHNIKRE
jgi:hypothetical protein